MAVIHIKKYTDEDGCEYIRASDVFDVLGMKEFDPKAEQAFQFLLLVEKVLNYYVTNSSTAFGNPDLARAEGCVQGYCMGKGWDWESSNGIIRVKKGRRTIFRIEKPAIPEREIARRREIRETMDELGF